MKNFLRMAQRQLSQGTDEPMGKQAVNTYSEGIAKFRKILRDDKAGNQSSRFRWGAPNTESNPAAEDHEDIEV